MSFQPGVPEDVRHHCKDEITRRGMQKNNDGQPPEKRHKMENMEEKQTARMDMTGKLDQPGKMQHSHVEDSQREDSQIEVREWC
mmetsp:Transcript_50315/g.113040  ORF Transcript_50315/g.113040 Transcript_50315/m.113040 type:complete len:84 (+) Transcript_50315:124-375(+)